MLEKTWKKHLGPELEKPYMLELKGFLKDELVQKKVIYPHGKNIFKAFELSSFEKTKVVILGQDPYHGEGQAMGLSFSVPANIALPPSLINIFKELAKDLDVPPPRSGDLSFWAEQGVLLLNSVLTVEKSKAHSHKDKGWEVFTDKTIEVLNQKKNGLVFILWGSHAQKKGDFIDINRHFVLKGTHPSPLSAYRGFFGKKYFSMANFYLKKQNLDEIKWV